ncbi:hypothetical protein LCGC14_1506460, partial [marine sediment metagenome]
MKALIFLFLILCFCCQGNPTVPLQDYSQLEETYNHLRAHKEMLSN